MTEDAVIVSAVRTPIGRLSGALKERSATELGAAAIRAVVERCGLDAGRVDDVLMGQVLQAGAGQNPARQAALGAGLPTTVPAMTLNQVCGAGQRSLHLAAQAVRLGDAQIVIAGGQESMTRAPLAAPGPRVAPKSGNLTMLDTMLQDGLIDAFHDVHMGTTAERIARERQITRAEQDAFALASQSKARAAVDAHRFDDELVPVAVAANGLERLVTSDEHPRPDVTIGDLEALLPIFAKGGTITAGNSSGLNDGAAATVVMSARVADQLQLEPMARIVSYASAGVDPMLMGLGPVPASQKALQLAGWSVDDLDLVESNEAFAAQSIAVNREMGWDTDIVNVNGGAIALGHPLAGSGCRMVVTLVHEMKRRGARRGLATMCIGGGQGVAICVER